MKVPLTARVDADERQKLDQLAKRAGLTRTDALRALLRSADKFEPGRAASVIFNSNGAEASQAHGAAA